VSTNSACALLVISSVIIVTVVFYCQCWQVIKRGVLTVFLFQNAVNFPVLLLKEVLVFCGVKLLLKVCFHFILILYLDYVKYIALPSHDHFKSNMFHLRNSCQYWKRHKSVRLDITDMHLWIDINWNTRFIHEFI
jgi:hypothetical protein